MFNKIKHVSPNSMIARVFLAFLATAGLFYVNIMPALVNGLIDGLGFTNQQAGAVGSANMGLYAFIIGLGKHYGLDADFISLTLGIAAFISSDIASIFFIANCLLGITWALVIAYLLGLAAKFDATGQMAALGGFASKMGLASGPVVAAWLLGEDSYQRLIFVAAIILLISAMLAWKPARLQDRTLP